jgi:AraC-like DNA-binding protein
LGRGAHEGHEGKEEGEARPMYLQPILTPALEAAIVGQQAILTSSLLSRFRRGAGHGIPLLAAILGSCCVMLLVNLAGVGAGRLGGVNLLLEMLLPAEIYLYVAQSGAPDRRLTRASALHAVPAFVGTTAWEAHLVSSMDSYVLVCWFAYLGAAGVVARRDAATVASGPRVTFVTTLLGSFAAIALLRLLMTFRLSATPSFREGLTYVGVLVVALAMTSKMLLTALRHPDVLDSPAASPKPAASSASDLDELARRFAALLEEEKPHLDPELTLGSLAVRLDVPERHLSQLVNSRFGMNFSAYMNRQRVLAAAQMLKTGPDAGTTAVKSVMYESGFRSKSAFNREFRRCFGMSPKEYRHRG